MGVRRVGIILVVCLSALTVLNMRAQTALSSFNVSPAAHHTQAKLILSADTAKPGDTILVGVDLKMESGWHTYWKNPGAAGMATQIKWQLPPGVTAGEIQWPLPKKLPPAEVTTYGYEDEVVLLVPLKIETNFPTGQINLKANVSWLECKDVCIPANQDVEAAINIVQSDGFYSLNLSNFFYVSYEKIIYSEKKCQTLYTDSRIRHFVIVFFLSNNVHF